MFTSHWGKACLLSRLRRFFAVVGVACPVFLAAPLAIPVAQANHLPAPITLTTLIPFDDLLIPVPTPFHPDGVAKQADFNGDGRTDLLVQAANGSGTTYLFLADANNKYTAIAQSWNASYLGLNWGADASTLYAGDYNGDGRADLIVESKVAGGRNGLIYSGPGGVMDTVYQTWDTPVPVGAAPTGLATNNTTAVDAITIFTLIPFDDLLIPVPVAFNPDGIRFKADLNGDGIADIFIQARNPGGSNYLLYGTRAPDGSIKYTSIGQSWTDSHLGLNWNAQAVTLRVENGQITAWTGSGADQTVWRFTPDASGKINAITQTWANAAGATAGSFDVTPTGAASYTIPIAVPPGINGMAPNLSLQYNSQSGNGLLGMGWNINGLSAIHRCPRTIAHNDGTNGTVNFDANDRFCLDGQRLMVVGAATDYGTVGKEYRTEIESFARVVSSGGTAGDPQSFTVYTKDGKIIEYGTTADSRVEGQGKTLARVWAANRIRDRKNNAITIAYTENSTQGEYYPSRIDYPKGRSMQFTYEARTDDISGYLGGSKVSITHRLTNIKTYTTNNVLVRDYRLVYQKGTLTGRSQLQSVQECGGADCMTPTSFTWKNGTATEFKAAPSGGLVDFNANGKADVIGNLQTEVSSHCVSQFHQGRIYFDGAGSYTGVATGANTVTYPNGATGVTVQWLGFAKNASMADFDGDGRSDVVWWEKVYANPSDNCVTNFETPTTLADKWYISYIGPETTFTWPDGTTGKYVSATKNELNWNVGGIVDLNADNKADILEVTGNALYARFSTGPTGRTFTARDTSASATGYTQGKLAAGDINGDGKPDLIEFKDSNFYYWLSTGVGFSGRQAGGAGYTNDANIQLRDVNADGRADIVEANGADATYVWLSNGNGFDTKIKWTADYLATDLLGTITTGLGATTTVNYVEVKDTTALPSGANANQIPRLNLYGELYTGVGGAGASNVQYQYGGLRIPVRVVSSYDASNGAGGTNTTSYSYADAVVSLVGRGFLGFGTVTATNSASQIKTESKYHQDFPRVGALSSLVQTKTVTTQTQTLYSLANTWTWRLSDAKQYLPYISSSTETNYEDNKISVTRVVQIPTATSLKISAYGNVLEQQITTQIPGQTYTQNTQNAYEIGAEIATPSIAEWHKIGLFQSSTVTNSATRLWGDIYNQGPASRKTSYTYDAYGLLKTEVIEPDKENTDSAKQTTTYDYDAYGNQAAVTVAGVGLGSGRITRTDYGPDGQFPVRVTNAAGHVATSVFDARFGTISRFVDANGLVTTRSYDNFGRLLREIRPDYSQTTLGYNRCNYGCQNGEKYYVTTQITGAPTVTVYYDTLNREHRRATDGFNGGLAITEKAYDALGRVSSISRPYYQGGVRYDTQYVYDDFNRVTKETAPDGGITSYVYKGIVSDTVGTGNAIEITDPRKNVTTRFTNALGKLIRIKDAKNGDTRYDHDPFGNLRYIKDSAGHETFMVYDVRGRRTLLSDLDKGATCRAPTDITTINCGAWRYEYNAAGDIVKQTDAKAQVVSIDYDALGRMTKRTEAEGVSQWIWDTAAQGRGKLAQVTGPGGYKRVHTYDALSRPVRVSSTLAGATYDIDTGYDQYGRIGSVGYPFTATDKRLTVYNSYTATGYLSEVKNAASGGTVYWKATGVDAEGRITQEALGNGLVTTRSFDPLGRVKSIATGSNIQNLAYAYDAMGNLSSRKDNAQSLTETFGYDELNRLTSVTGPAPKSYAYSADGNITAKSDIGDQYLYGATSTPTGTPAGPHAVTSIKKASALIGSYSYDANGNLLTGGGRSLSYTSFNLPSAITQGTATATFTYDADHARATQVAGGETTVYLNPRWDDGIHFEKTTKASGLIEHRHYLYAGNTPVALYTTRSDNTSSTRYLHKDHLGSVDAITNETGALAERLSYDAWGRRRQGNWLDATAPITGATTHHGYTGHEHLDGLGLIHINARVYDPAIGRFLQADPIGFEGGLNLYGYAEGNPLLYIDQNGLDAIKFNLTGAVFSGGSVSLLLNPKTGDVFFSGGPTVGANIGWSLVYTTDTPKEGWKWNFVVERKFLGAGWQLESSWDATEFSRTGKHKFDVDPAFGLGVGAGQSATFEGTTKLFNFYTITNKIGGEFDNFNRYMDETLRSWSVRDIGSFFR